MKKGCGVLFKSAMGNILVCGEVRSDGYCFLCKWCLKEYKSKGGKK